MTRVNREGDGKKPLTTLDLLRRRLERWNSPAEVAHREAEAAAHRDLLQTGARVLLRMIDVARRRREPGQNRE